MGVDKYPVYHTMCMYIYMYVLYACILEVHTYYLLAIA